MKNKHVAIVGATGAVGREFVGCIEQRGVPLASLKLLASVRSAGQKQSFRGQELTIEACQCSQFEQHMRAVAGWPLGDPSRHGDAVMENIIGAEADAWEALAKTGALHLYGKAESRPGRKMGHVTALGARREEALARAHAAAERFTP